MKAGRLLLAMTCLSVGTAAAAETIAYTYDARGRIVTVVHSGGPVNGTTTTYNHDPADNRTRVQVTGAPH